MATRLIVKRQDRRHWGIYDGDKMIEGGFFSKVAAETTAEEYRTAHAEMAEAYRSRCPICGGSNCKNPDCGSR